MTDKLDYSDGNYTLLQERRCRIMKEENQRSGLTKEWSTKHLQNGRFIFFNTYLSIIPYSKSVFKNIKISKSNLLVWRVPFFWLFYFFLFYIFVFAFLCNSVNTIRCVCVKYLTFKSHVETKETHWWSI